jgi:hypothetical protein
MALATLIAITLACIAWSLWIRRVTWTRRWDVAATLNIALQGTAPRLGVWNLEDYIGHDWYLVAASAIVYNAIGRLAEDHTMAALFNRHVEFPATMCKMKWFRGANR